MPKDEFDFDDPMELNGMGLLSNEDTTDAMTECFVEEFMRMGYDHKQVLTLFRNPHYIGMNMVLQNRGEEFVKGSIQEIFARWGRIVDWNECSCGKLHHANKTPEQTVPLDRTLRDPTGAPIPKLTL
jgi:hypothetical protein